VLTCDELTFDVQTSGVPGAPVLRPIATPAGRDLVPRDES
jgi:hypothetical protein